MNNQVILCRYEYPLDEYHKDTSELFDFTKTFKPVFENGAQVGGVCGVYNVSAKTAILLVHDIESDLFLRLKFAGNNAVKVNRYF